MYVNMNKFHVESKRFTDGRKLEFQGFLSQMWN
jgi:hypothetical protein